MAWIILPRRPNRKRQVFVLAGMLMRSTTRRGGTMGGGAASVRGGFLCGGILIRPRATPGFECNHRLSSCCPGLLGDRPQYGACVNAAEIR